MAAVLNRVVIPPTYTLRRPGVYVVVGCGGTGARIVPALVKMLTPDDAVVLVDGDRVEAHNLLRQHFVDADVGRYKAEVLAERYQLEDGPYMLAHNGMLTSRWAVPPLPSVNTTAGRYSRSYICLIGCVDSREARRTIHQALGAWGTYLWLDCGNERYSGQVLLGMRHWPALVKQYLERDGALVTSTAIDNLASYQRSMGAMPYTRSREAIEQAGCLLTVRTMDTILPSLVDPGAADPAQVGCAIRIDTQTVAANMMAASCAINLLTYVIDGIPTSTLGMLFDISGVMQQVRLRRVTPAQRGDYMHEGLPELVQPQLAGAA